MSFVDYVKYTILVDAFPNLSMEESVEIILSEVCELPFESFESAENRLLAYIPAANDSPSFMEVIKAIHGVIDVKRILIRGENWNVVWEQSFEPITIEKKVIVRAPFHDIVNIYEHEIIIEPKMAFGTGHHSTTRLMMEEMLDLNLEQKSVLDMGCGTGILAILAAKMGAQPVVAVDNDPQCIINSKENIGVNGCEIIQVYENDEISANFKTDIIIANIQKNVLIEQMPWYKKWLNEKGILLVSGIYEEAVEDVVKAATNNNMVFVKTRKLNEWCMIAFSN